MGDVVKLGSRKRLSGPPDPAAPLKELVLANMLDSGVVVILLDSTMPAVDVPASQRGECLKLSLSRKFKHEDLKLSADGIIQTLSFDGKDHPCAIPWGAVYCIGTVLFSRSIPANVLVQLTQKEAAIGVRRKLVEKVDA